MDNGRRVGRRTLGLGLLVLALGCGPRAVAPRFASSDTPTVASNILSGDYAGSAACKGCHGTLFAAWTGSPMHGMTRLPEAAAVHAPFDGHVWSFKDDKLELQSRGGDRFMRVTSGAGAEAKEHIYRVTKVIGGHHREDFAGLEVASTDIGAEVVGNPHKELLLPASFVFDGGAFRLKGYSVMVGERPGLRAGGVWNETCVLCHNTTPYFDTLWGALHGPGAPVYQGEVVDRVLPEAQRWHWEVGDEAALTTAVNAEVRRLGGEPARGDRETTLRQAINVMHTRLGPEHFVEVGIGCESCHGGSREHADNPKIAPSFVPHTGFLRPAPAPGAVTVSRAEQINRTCARCHQVLFSRYAYTWEGGMRRSGAPGGSNINSGEARDFLLGGCSRAMACTTCHDPHGGTPAETLARLATPAGNATCTTCHKQYASADQVRAHTHHDPAGAGGACLSCHMPRKNTGLGYSLTRYHRIGSPTDKVRVESDRPLECALCHPRKSTETLVGDMERFWGKQFDRRALRALYGDLSESPITATLARGKPHEKLTAMHVAGDAKMTEAWGGVVEALVHTMPLVRAHAKRVLDELAVRPCAVDLDRDTGEIAKAAHGCLGPEDGARVARIDAKAAAAKAAVKPSGRRRVETEIDED